MKIISLKKTKSLRKSRNQEILWRMDNGESLTSFNSYQSWFPPRPVVKKDAGAIQKLYGADPDKRLEHAADAAAQGEEGSVRSSFPLKLA